jgi:iron complex transport system ATP-binding protein
MPQRPLMPDEMNVVNYVLLGRTPHLGYLGSESPDDLESVGRAIERLALVELSDRPLSTLSGGEAQRVVMARALAQEAPVLLLDEPTSSLDIGHALDVLEILDELRRNEGLTVVTALHDLTLAGRFADRLVLLDKGKVAADGSASDVLTEDTLIPSYGAGIRVVTNGDGPTVIPTRRHSDRSSPPTD